MTSRKNY